MHKPMESQESLQIRPAKSCKYKYMSRHYILYVYNIHIIYIYTPIYVNMYIYIYMCVSVYKSHSQEFDTGTAHLIRRSTKPSNFDSKRSTILTNEDGAKKKSMSSNWKLEQQPHSNIFQPLFLATNLLLRAVSSWILLWGEQCLSYLLAMCWVPVTVWVQWKISVAIPIPLGWSRNKV